MFLPKIWLKSPNFNTVKEMIFFVVFLAGKSIFTVLTTFKNVSKDIYTGNRHVYKIK